MILPTHALTLSAASLPPPFVASITNTGININSPIPSKRYTILLLSIPFRVFVYPAKRAEVRPPTTIPPKRRAKRMVDGLIWAGLRRRYESVVRVLVINGIEKRLRIASRRKAWRMVEPDWEGMGWMDGLEAGDRVDMMRSKYWIGSLIDRLGKGKGW